jgi:hypothetical protein
MTNDQVAASVLDCFKRASLNPQHTCHYAESRTQRDDRSYQRPAESQAYWNGQQEHPDREMDRCRFDSLLASPISHHGTYAAP